MLSRLVYTGYVKVTQLIAVRISMMLKTQILYYQFSSIMTVIITS